MLIARVRAGHPAGRRVDRDRHPGNRRENPLEPGRAETMKAYEARSWQDQAILVHQPWRHHEVDGLGECGAKNAGGRRHRTSTNERAHQCISVQDHEKSHSPRLCLRTSSRARIMASSSSRTPSSRSRMASTSRWSAASRSTRSATSSDNGIPRHAACASSSVRASSDSSIVTIDMKGSIAALRASSADPLANPSPARRCM